MGDWKHNDLAADLATHLRGYARPAMIWRDMQLGPQGSARPDVYTVDPTYKALRAVAYEIKISRADFARDVQAGKALGYFAYAGAVVFATPKSLIKRDELPAGCGLIERNETTWRWSKKPTINPLTTLPFEAWMKLLMDGTKRDEGGGVLPVERRADEWKQQDRARKLLGEDLGRLLADRDRARVLLEHEKRRATDETEQLEAKRRAQDAHHLAWQRAKVEELEQVLRAAAVELGLPSTSHHTAVIRRLRELLPSAAGDRAEEFAMDLDSIADTAAKLAAQMRPPRATTGP